MQYGEYDLSLREVLTAQVRFGKEEKDIIVDSGGARSLMPLKYARKTFNNLIEPVTDLIQLIQPDGQLLTNLKYKVSIPIIEIKAGNGQKMKIRKGTNVTFYLGENVPFIALSKPAIDQLNLWGSLEYLSKNSKDKFQISENSILIPKEVSPIFANVPSWLSDTKWNVLKQIHNDMEMGHGGEQRTYALALKKFPQLKITREDVKEYLKYCVSCQKSSTKKFNVPHSPIDDINLNMMIADVWVIGDVEDKKLSILAVMDLKSRYVILEELESLTSEETALKLLKIGAIFNFKNCILRTDPGTNFTGPDVQSLLKIMRATWEVGMPGNHLEQAHIERCFRELNANLRPILASLTTSALSSHIKIRMGVYIAARIYNNSINYMGFAPAEMFTPSETLELQIVQEDLNENKRSSVIRQILDVQQEVLSKMLIAQQELFDKRMDNWTNEGKAAWDELLGLEIDDYVMINYPKNQKLNYSNIGPYKVIQMVDKEYFVVVQSLVDPNVQIRIKANRLIRFNYDKRCNQTLVQIQGQDNRGAEVETILDHNFPGGKDKYEGKAGERQQLTFLVKFRTGQEVWMSWEEVKYLVALDKYLDTNAFNRKITHQLRTKEKVRKISGPVFMLIWKEAFDNSFMVKPDGVLLSEDEEIQLNQIKIGGTADEKKKVKALLEKYKIIFQKRKRGQFMNYPRVKYKEKTGIDESKLFGRKWEDPRKIYDPRAQAACINILQELIDVGTIEEIPLEKDTMEWNTPINMVIDKYVEEDGVKLPVFRLCFDSRGVNARKVVEPFPIVSVEEIFQNLAGKKYQSIMDLPKAFFSIEVDEDSRKFSSFTHPGNGKRYWFRGMVMGDVNSPTHLQTFMNRVFREEKPYMDDLATGDYTFDEHLEHLEKIFKLCLENGVSLSPKKCFFNMNSLKVLGRITDQNWRKVDDETINRIKTHTKPYTVRQLMSFLGLVNWLRDYLPNLGEKAQPLYALIQDKDLENLEENKSKKRRIFYRSKINWTDELIQLFEEIKEFCSNPVKLHYINYNRPIYVNTDASLKGWGGIIYQLDNDGNKLICGIKSGSWNKVQAKWPTVEQECYAIYRTVVDFEPLLIGRPFTLFTDSKNLTFLKESPSRKIQRWKLAMQMFNFEIQHISGEENKEADSLSRISSYD